MGRVARIRGSGVLAVQASPQIQTLLTHTMNTDDALLLCIGTMTIEAQAPFSVATFIASFTIDGVVAPFVPSEHLVGGNENISFDTFGLIPITRGLHTFALRCQQTGSTVNANYALGRCQMILLFFPTLDDGQTLT